MAEDFDADIIDNLEELDKENNDYSYFSDTLNAYLKETHKYELLSKDKFIELFNKYKRGDEEAGKRIIECNLRLVPYTIKRFFEVKSEQDFLDMIQDGNFGVMRALEKFDLSFEVNFSTYAIFWIQQRIRRGRDSYADSIRIPAHTLRIFRAYKKFSKLYFINNGKMPSEKEIKDALKINDETLKVLFDIQNNLSELSSLNKLVGEEDEGEELGDFISSNSEEYDNYIKNLSSKSLFYFLKHKLIPRYYYILFYRFYLQEPLSLKTIGQVFDVSRERIRQLEVYIMRKVKLYISIGIPDNYTAKEDDLLPFPFRETIILLYLKEFLTPYEYYILYNYWYKNGNLEENDVEEYKSILEKYNDYLTNPLTYKEVIIKNIISKYNIDHIPNIDLTPSMDNLKVENKINKSLNRKNN